MHDNVRIYLLPLIRKKVNGIGRDAGAPGQTTFARLETSSPAVQAREIGIHAIISATVGQPEPGEPPHTTTVRNYLSRCV